MKINEVEIVYKRKNSLKPKFNGSKQACNILRPFYEGFIDHRESFKILLCDRNNRMLGVHHVSEGGLAGTVVDLKIIGQSMLLSNCSAIILCHNHPSGNLQPSNQDKAVTEKIYNLCKVFDIKLLDHIIITSETYFSFADEGILNY
tara:strand:- start:55 stop:492 length:438 start_codon:yes stop_codon:yes gene_type:complete